MYIKAHKLSLSILILKYFSVFMCYFAIYYLNKWTYLMNIRRNRLFILHIYLKKYTYIYPKNFLLYLYHQIPKN